MMRRQKQTGGRGAWFALVLPLLFVASPLGAQQGAEPFSISVDVNLVVLHASVHDRHGRDVLNLRQQDFTVYEDGVPQTIRVFRREDAPVTAGIVVDHSGSMRGKLSDVTAAARIFAESGNPKDQMFIVNFNEKISFGLAGVNQFTDNPSELERGIAQTPADGQTALYDAIAAGLERLEAGRWDKKVLVVVSDGGDNASVKRFSDVTEMASRSSAVIYTIGVYSVNDPDANPGVLKRLAEATGGESFFPKETSEITDICDHIAREIRNQYMIGYASANMKPDGSYRSVRLVAAAPGAGKLKVRTRRGYIPRGGAR